MKPVKNQLQDLYDIFFNNKENNLSNMPENDAGFDLNLVNRKLAPNAKRKILLYINWAIENNLSVSYVSDRIKSEGSILKWEKDYAAKVIQSYVTRVNNESQPPKRNFIINAIQQLFSK